MADLIPPDLTSLDRAALSWFLLAWLGYGQFIRFPADQFGFVVPGHQWNLV